MRQKVNAMDTGALVAQWTKAGASVEQLAGSPELKLALVNISEASVKLNTILAKFEKDGPTGEQLAGTVEDAKKAISAFNATVTTVQRFINAQQNLGDDAAKALADAAKTAADKAAADAAAAAPEIKYEIKAPEGVSVDPAFITALTPSLKKAGISNEQLQTIAEGYLQFQQGLPAAILERDLAITAKDPNLGGMRYGQTLKEVNLAIEAFGDPDFKKFVAQAGIGNRLEFVRVFQRIGEAMARAGDTPARGQPDAGAETTIAQRLYGRTKSNS